MRLVVLVCNANQKIKEALDKASRSFLSDQDALFVTKTTDPAYIAGKLSVYCGQDHGDDSDLYVVALLLNKNQEYADSLRSQCVGPLFLTTEAYQQSETRHFVAQLARIIMVELAHARKLLRVVKKEFKERDTKTPVLLPIRNFGSHELVDLLFAIQRLRPPDPDYSQAFRELVREAENGGLRSFLDERKSFFENARKIRFFGPSKAGARHGRASAAPPHVANCLVAGYFRLGARYDERFHYDCSYRSGGIWGVFEDCHGSTVTISYRKYINIAPNDNVRGQ